MRLAPATLKGHFFSNRKGRFIPVGAHWVPAMAALDWTQEWDEASVEADFAKMKDLGFNTVRFDLFWAWFEPYPGIYNPEAFTQLDFLVKLAHRYQIYLHPALFIGGEVGEAFWDVPWRHGRHPHADPEMLRLETDHAAELARRYHGEPAILAWDLTDEPPFWIVSGQTTDAMAINWTRLIAGAIRQNDPGRPLVVGISTDDLGHGPFRPDLIADEVDFFSAHPYSIYEPGLFPDPMLSTRGTYCGALQTLLGTGAGHPVMIHELGASSAQYTPERIAAFDRTTMYSSLAAGTNGFLLWCYTDAAPETYHRTPYLRAPHETQFGLTTWDRQDRPQGVELRQFSQILEQLDLTDLEPEPATAGVIVPHEWSKPHGDFSHLGLKANSRIPYVSTQDGGAVAGGAFHEQGELNRWLVGAWLSTLILARQAGMKVGFPREYTRWQDLPLVLLPSPLTSTSDNLVHVHTNFWESVPTYVKQGGSVYASLCADVAIPEMEDLFGARLSDHVPVSEIKLKVVEPMGDLQVGETFHYHADSSTPRSWAAMVEVKGGQVIAQDQDGWPALIAHQYGKGKTLLCTYPLESYLALTPCAFEGQDNSYRIYHSFSQWVGAGSLFSTNQPMVEVGALAGPERGYVIFANHAAQAVNATVSSRLSIKRIRYVTPSGYQEVKINLGSWQIAIDEFNGVIMEWFL
ncbi:MAG: beta-galactosidase [Anaerolineales bacterium]